MPKFRKKPVVIEAVQVPDWNAVGWQDIATWCKGSYVVDALGECILIDTLEGQMRADPGDWIIKGVMGEFYPCKDEVFRQTYEPVEG